MAAERSERRNLFKPKTRSNVPSRAGGGFTPSYSGHNHECVFEGEEVASVSSGAFNTELLMNWRLSFPHLGSMWIQSPQKVTVFTCVLLTWKTLKCSGCSCKFQPSGLLQLLLRAGGFVLPLTAPRSPPCFRTLLHRSNPHKQLQDHQGLWGADSGP